MFKTKNLLYFSSLGGDMKVPIGSGVNPSRYPYTTPYDSFIFFNGGGSSVSAVTVTGNYPNGTAFTIYTTEASFCCYLPKGTVIENTPMPVSNVRVYEAVEESSVGGR